MLIVQSRVLSTGEIKRLREAAFTYAEVGATRDGTQPSGSTSVRRTRTIGVGRERFEQASRILLGWDMHRRAMASLRHCFRPRSRLGWGGILASTIRP